MRIRVPGCYDCWKAGLWGAQNPEGPRHPPCQNPDPLHGGEWLETDCIPGKPATPTSKPLPKVSAGDKFYQALKKAGYVLKDGEYR